MNWLSALPQDPLSLAIWLGSAVGVGVILSYWIERRTWFVALTTVRKEWVIAGFCFGLPAVSWILQVLLWLSGPEFPKPALPFGQDAGAWIIWGWAFVLNCLAIYGASQLAHTLDQIGTAAAAKNR